LSAVEERGVFCDGTLLVSEVEEKGIRKEREFSRSIVHVVHYEKG